MASDLSLERPAVRLSGKEVSGLAGRVLVAALVPPGATGGAAEAIEFLELTEGGALARLDGEKEGLVGVDWRAPLVVFEEGNVAKLDAHGVPAHFFGPVLADWLSAMALEHGSGGLQVSAVRSAGLLATSTWFLASQGLSSAVLLSDAEGRASFRLMLVGKGWTLLQWPQGQVPAAFVDLADKAAVADFLEVVAGDALSHLSAGVQCDATLPADSAMIVAFKRDAAPEMELPAGTRINAITSTQYGALKADILAKGWPLDRDLWERLMAFADKSLIPTSERSRLGSG